MNSLDTLNKTIKDYQEEALEIGFERGETAGFNTGFWVGFISGIITVMGVTIMYLRV
jgi:hypothetical protein